MSCRRLPNDAATSASQSHLSVPVEQHQTTSICSSQETKELPYPGANMSSSACGAATSVASRFEASSALDFEDLSCFSAPASALPAASPPPRAAPRGNRIARISEETAAAISSQQVVIDLKSICKELVENALDAGATSIEVRLMDCGLGGVEVRDNGSGISPQDLELLGCRHATSKIASFEDVYSKLDSLGFRGEALASLCFVARISLVTRCRSADFGTRVFFDHNGRQIAREATAREVGTTVIVEDIFARMPLRRRTMEQTKQRQLQDALALLQRIALLHATSCRIVLSNCDPKTVWNAHALRGGRSTFLATKGTSAGLLEAALSVYGAKQLAACTELTLSGDEPGREWRLEVVISRPPHGVRSAGLQHFFVKRRAVEFPPLLQKLLNKKWKEVSSRGLFPVCLGFLELDASLLDINVRKDKQQVLLAVERDIAQALLEAISKILAPSVGSFEHEASRKQRQLEVKTCMLSQEPVASQQPQQLERQQHAYERLEEQQQLCVSAEQGVMAQIAEGQQQPQEEEQKQQEQRPMAIEWKEASAVDAQNGPSRKEVPGTDSDSPSVASASSVCGRLRDEQSSVRRDGARQASAESTGVQDCGNGAADPPRKLPLSDVMRTMQPLSVPRRQRHVYSQLGGGGDRGQQKQLTQSQPQLAEGQGAGQPLNRRPSMQLQHHEEVETLVVRSTDSDSSGMRTLPAEAPARSENRMPAPGTDEEADWLAGEVLSAAVGECFLDLDEIYDVREHGATPGPAEQEELPSSQLDAEWASSDPPQAWLEAPADFSLKSGDNTSGEMRKAPDFFLFKKDFFRDLTLVGQFNEGFIIAALRRTKTGFSMRAPGYEPEDMDICSSTGGSSNSSGAKTVTSLFIIDQHASDEKRIFESLNAEFSPRMQPLIAPLRLSLPAELLAAVEAFAPHLTSNGFACIVCGPSRPERPLQAPHLVIAPVGSQMSTMASIGDSLREAPPPSTLRSQQQRLQPPRRAESVDSGSERREGENTEGDASPVEDENEMDVEGRHCFLTGLPVIEGRQLCAADFIEFLAALASEDQGKAMWKGTMPQPPPAGAATGNASQRGPLSHHRILQYRPSRVWDILASKACRSAVMIGDPLSPQRQIGILRRMAGLQLPFNCPHGRPTMRHLLDLSDDISRADEHRNPQQSEPDGAYAIEHQDQHAPSEGLPGKKRQLPALPVASGNLGKGDRVNDSYRQKRPALATQDPENLQRKNGPRGDSHGSHDFVAQSSTKDSATGRDPDSAPTPSPQDDFPPLFSEDEGLENCQEGSQAVDALRETKLYAHTGHPEHPPDGTDDGLARFRLTFIG